MICNHSIPDPNCDVCALQPLQRNHFFDGKLMMARHFVFESDFGRSLHRRHNSYLHGTGTVCGALITQHPDPTCRRQYVVLQPGLVLDCCGHEIVIPEKKAVDVAGLVKAALNDQGRQKLAPDDRLSVRLQLAYQEQGAVPTPAILDDCDTGGGEECDLIEESYTVQVAVALNEGLKPVDSVLEPRLEWKQTITADLPQAAIVDRELGRLYVAGTDQDGDYLRVFDTTQAHRLKVYKLLRAVAAPGVTTPGVGALALSRSGGRIYVALRSPDAATPASILVLDRQALENDSLPDPLPALKLPAGQQVFRMDSGVRDDALLVLTADFANGDQAFLRAWSAGQMLQLLSGADPNPASEDRDLTDLLQQAKNNPNPAVAGLKPVDMSQSTDGRWLVLTDNNPAPANGAGRIVTLYLSGFDNAAGNPKDFINAFDLPADRVAVALRISFDGGYLNILSHSAAGAAFLLRAQVDQTSLETYLPLLADQDRWRELSLVGKGDADLAPEVLSAVDLAATPRDNFVYVLRRRMNAGAQADRGDILVVDVDRMTRPAPQPGSDAYEQTVRQGAVLEDRVDFQTLSPLGNRLYVASHLQGSNEGMLRAYDIDEATCDTFFQRVINEGCDGCATTQPVTIASFQNFQLDQPMVDSDPGDGSTVNVIDNFAERETLPSTNTLQKVIQCMLDKGFNEGVPGPRGTEGPPGANGLNGRNGDPGPRGPGVVEAVRRAGAVDADLEKINPADPNSDFRLIVTLPDVAVPPVPEFNQVIGANYVHDELFNLDRFTRRFTNPDDDAKSGILLVFEQSVLARTLNNRTVQMFAFQRQGDNAIMAPMVLVEVEVIPIRFDQKTDNADVVYLDGYHIDLSNHEIFILDASVKPVLDLGLQNDQAQAVLLRPLRAAPADQYNQLLNLTASEDFPRDLDPEIKQLPNLRLLQVVLHGHQILTKDGLSLDCNLDKIDPRKNLPPNVASQAVSGEWVTFLHIGDNDIG